MTASYRQSRVTVKAPSTQLFVSFTEKCDNSTPPLTILFRSERNHRVHLRRPAPRQITSQQGNHPQQQGNECKCRRVCRTNDVEQVFLLRKILGVCSLKRWF